MASNVAKLGGDEIDPWSALNGGMFRKMTGHGWGRVSGQVFLELFVGGRVWGV